MQGSPQASTSRSLPGSPAIPRGRSELANGEKPPGKRPKVLFMGPRSGGKSSIRKVVFEKMAPNDTLFIEKGIKGEDDEDVNLFSLPSGPPVPSSWPSFHDTGAIIFVLDAQSSSSFLQDMIRKLAFTMKKAFDENPGIQFEIFLHKIDGMSTEYRLDILQNLRDRLTEDLFDLSPELESSLNVFYHLTSVFDTSIYEALSKVIQKLIPEQGMLERLLDLLCQQCMMDKAFLFDTSSKIYIATDSLPLDGQTYVICSDYLDLIGDFTTLYEPSAAATSPHSRSVSLASSTRIPAPLHLSRMDSSTSSLASPSRSPNPAPPPSSIGDGRVGGRKRLPCSYAKLGTSSTIAQWGINANLSLVALLRPNSMEQHEALIDYNVATFKDAVLAIFDLGLEGHPDL
ncbi:Ras-related GTP-binding protein C [Pseudohyphozyma bogoriensis]|nr:Ras-related GTP-binding protein C [Pseudohyphozyma bogoriensis]